MTAQMCRSGLHPWSGKGRCEPCRAEAQRRSRGSEPREQLHRAIVLVRSPIMPDVAEWLRGQADLLEAKPEVATNSLGGFYTGRLA